MGGISVNRRTRMVFLAVVFLAAQGQVARAASDLESRLMRYVDLATSLGRGLGILGAIAGAAGLIFSPNEEGKRKFKTVLVGCAVLALASVIVNAIWEVNR